MADPTELKYESLDLEQQKAMIESQLRNLENEHFQLSLLVPPDALVETNAQMARMAQIVEQVKVLKAKVKELTEPAQAKKATARKGADKRS